MNTPGPVSIFTRSILSSDSSMVDEYQEHRHQTAIWTWFRFLYGRWIRPKIAQTGLAITKFRFLYGRWIHSYKKLIRDDARVQIPLWSMNTASHDVVFIPLLVFRFLYGRWIRNGEGQEFPDATRSDSSMVDEYLLPKLSRAGCLLVQIPLWSMNTIRSLGHRPG